jgi:hypothetical protein
MTLVLVLFSCESGNETNDSEQVNLKPFNAPDQKKFALAWLEIRDQYQKTENPIKQKNLANSLKTLLEHKKFKNWIGQIKKLIAMNSYVQVQINQMFSYNDKTDMVYYLDISKESDIYDYLVNLKEGDTVRFSGEIENEFSLTEYGMVTEPMLSVICSVLDGHKNSVDNLEDVQYQEDENENSSDSWKTSINKTCSWCNKSFSGTHYTHVGKLSPCYSSTSTSSIGTYCSMSCCSSARKSSCPTCQ